VADARVAAGHQRGFAAQVESGRHVLGRSRRQRYKALPRRLVPPAAVGGESVKKTSVYFSRTQKKPSAPAW
jgi:hypothetical protein